ncbi:hypothetical protein [Planctomycetes bacterium TBK1r]|uniref:Core-binding (CB) domain-containing protein n=1 Tax=Stieleria magnilauensis TaxID=2527963 RepID=A0ABX5XYQ8_9BACT|nr:hypothetical protein TBK1r_62020 [Planctomycetes bacterium TBK1r]
MPRKVNQSNYPELTYQEKQGKRPRWRKRHKGKEYSWPRNDGESLDASYRRALAAWQKKKAELDSAAEDEANIAARAEAYWTNRVAELEAVIESVESDPKAVGKTTEHAEWLKLKQLRQLYEERAILAERPLPLDANGELLSPKSVPAPWDLKIEKPARDAAGETMRTAIDTFLGRQLAKHKKGELSAKRYGALKAALNHACEILDESSPIEAFNGLWLERYRDELEQSILAKDLAPSSGRDRLQALKQFVRWAYERGTIERPRNLDSKDMNIRASTPNPKVFNDTELTTLFAGEPSERLRLYLLLMLNIGATQKDLADLRKDQFDARAGTITRQRSKTSANHSDSVPTVTWTLWPETLTLLKKHRNKDKSEDLLLTNENGRPLKTVEIVDGNERVIDNVKSAYRRLREKMKRRGTDVGKPMKLLRATGATKLGSHPDYARYAQYFLAQSGRTVADRHYVVPSQDQFDKAVLWLGAQWPDLSGVKKG